MNIQTNFIQKLGSADFESWILVQKAYQNYAFGEEIMESGFNTNSGYVYIALENGVQIASCFGQEVDYIVYNTETDEELFFPTYKLAIDYEY